MAQTKPILDRKAAETMNLNVLKRLDPHVEELLATAAHVALYDFDVPSRKWTRKNVEGSLFLVKRSQMPRFRFVILNKKSAENYVEDVVGGFEAELNSPYLLYRNKAKEVIGIWFFEESDCKRVADLITKISSTFAAPNDVELGGIDQEERSLGQAPKTVTNTAIATNATNGAEKHHDNDSDGLSFWDKPQSSSLPVAVPAAGVTVMGTDEGHSSHSSLLAKMFPSLAVTSSAPSSQLPSRPSMQLLTPQFLQQQQQQQQQSEGDLLLQKLQKKTFGEQTPTGAGFLLQEKSAAVPSNGTAVASLLRSLAENATFCRELEQELVQAGFSLPSPP